MVRITCDRCGRVIQNSVLPLMNVKFPVLDISVKYNLIEEAGKVDLCDNCRREFFDWLNVKEEDEG